MKTESKPSLESNALNANETYMNSYVELAGVLGKADEDGTFYLAPANDQWSYYDVQCVLLTDKQKSKVAKMKVGQTVKVRGEITLVGDVLGYGMMVFRIY